jgi:hypothetical protein
VYSCHVTCPAVLKPNPTACAPCQATADDLDEAFLSLDEVALGQEAGLEDIDLDEDDEFGGWLSAP